MAWILNLETATKSCSVAIGKDGDVVALKELCTEKFSHAEKLHLFIEEVIVEAGITLSDLDAIAVGKGPGSYTGLRIGVSAAKGLAYGLDIPLLSIYTLETLTVCQIRNYPAAKLFCPMLDARRMEVYSAIYDRQLNQIEPVEAIILESDFRHKYLKEEQLVFFGSGAEKLKDVLLDSHAIYDKEKYPSSSDMVSISEKKYNDSEFEDKAYFEPFYLKDFIAGKPKKAF